MAEIKFNEGFIAEVEAFRASGEAFDPGNVYQISKDGISLDTVNAYHDRLHNISLMLDLFKYLVEKDAKDMDDLIGNFQRADSGHGGSFGGGGGGGRF